MRYATHNLAASSKALHNRRVKRELNVPDGAEVVSQPRDFAPRLTGQRCERDRICAVGRQRLRLGPRTAMKGQASDLGGLHLTVLASPARPPFNSWRVR